MGSRIAIVGATGTIGECIARRLHQSGESLLLVGRNQDKLAALAADLQQPFEVVDFSTSEGLESAVRRHTDASVRLGGIVNCIGSILLKPVQSTSDDEFRQTIETNLFTAFATIRTAAKLMREHGGSVVLFASAAAEIGISNHEAIAAAKAGIIGISRSAAATLAPNNIRVNVISPGLIRTNLTKRIWDNPASASASAAMHALGRLGEPAHVASLAAWLLSAENDWVTGQVIGVDGGLGHLLPRR
ncbi:MAG: SDR family NAD(P)-dependent oxidoreductase [Planctomyces sp.]|jgi:3-oxoacyl-[acyl-carrier protein] reductase